MLNKKIEIFIISLIVALGAVSSAFTRTSAEKISMIAPAPTPLAGKPPYSAYKGVSIDMTMDEARAKLGKAKETSDTQDFYIFSDNESAQVFYGPAKTVSAVTVTYTGKLDAAPTAKAVFGEDAEVKPDGGIFKMARYPKYGFWISYNKTAGDDALIIIAMQKI